MLVLIPFVSAETNSSNFTHNIIVTPLIETNSSNYEHLILFDFLSGAVNSSNYTHNFGSIYLLLAENQKPYQVKIDTITNVTTSASLTNITFNFIALDDSGISNMSYNLSWATGSNNEDIKENTTILTPMDVYGLFNLTLIVQDYWGNTNMTSIPFTVTYAVTGGGGGGEGEVTPEPEEPEEITIEPIEEEITFDKDNPIIIPSNPIESPIPAQEIIDKEILDLIDVLDGKEPTTEDLTNLVEDLEEQGIIVDLEDLEVWYDNYVDVVIPIVTATSGGGGGSASENIGTPSFIFTTDLTTNIIGMTPWGSGSYNLISVPDSTSERDTILINEGEQTESVYIQLLSTGTEEFDVSKYITLDSENIVYNEDTGLYYFELLPGMDMRETITALINIPEDAEFGDEIYFSLILLNSDGNVRGKLTDYKISIERKGFLFNLKSVFFGKKLSLPRPNGLEPIPINNSILIIILPLLLSTIFFFILGMSYSKKASATISIFIFFLLGIIALLLMFLL